MNNKILFYIAITVIDIAYWTNNYVNLMIFLFPFINVQNTISVIPFNFNYYILFTIYIWIPLLLIVYNKFFNDDFGFKLVANDIITRFIILLFIFQFTHLFNTFPKGLDLSFFINNSFFSSFLFILYPIIFLVINIYPMLFIFILIIISDKITNFGDADYE